MAGFIDGQLPHGSDFEARFAQYLALGSLSSFITSLLSTVDAASARAVMGVGSSTLGGTNGQLLYNNSGVQGGLTIAGDATLNSSNGVLTIAANAVSNAKLAQMAANTIKGNNTAGLANASDLTAAQITAILNPFSATLQGVVPLSGGGTTNYLRADGNWASPIFLGGPLSVSTSMTNKDFREAKGAAVVAASTTDIWAGADGNTRHVTGTSATITGLGTAPQAGMKMTVNFDSAGNTITHNGTSLVLPGATNIITQAGDRAEFFADTTTNMICLWYVKADGRAIVPPQARFVSGLITFSASASFSTAHGLGAVPASITTYIQCSTAELGYSIGDRLWIGNAGVGLGTAGIFTISDATNVILLVGTAYNIFNKATPGSAMGPITMANWKLGFLASL